MQEYPLDFVLNIYNLSSYPFNLSKKQFIVQADSCHPGYYFHKDGLTGKVLFLDIDKDNFQDIVASINNKILVFGGYDTAFTAPLYDLTFSSDRYGFARTKFGYANIDLDEDNLQEIVLTSDNIIRIISFNGSGIEMTDSTIIDDDYDLCTGPIISDLDGDNYPEIIVGAKYEGDVNSADHMMIFIFDSNLNEKSGWIKVKLHGIEDGDIVVEDINDDGMHDIILQTDSELYVFNIPWAFSGEKTGSRIMEI